MKLNNEIKIGMMVFAAIVLLVSLTFKAEKMSFSKKGYVVKVQFKDVNGVNLNSPVMFNGYEMGEVTNVEIKDDTEDIKMELTLWLDEKAKLREGSKAYVKNLGLMGEKYVGLTSGLKNSPYLAPGAIIFGEETPSFEQLVGDGKEISQELKEISRNINERLETNKERVDGILESMNESLHNVASITDNLDQRLNVNKEHIDHIVANLEVTSKNLEEMSQDLKLHPWKIMYKGQEKNKKE